MRFSGFCTAVSGQNIFDRIDHNLRVLTLIKYVLQKGSKKNRKKEQKVRSEIRSNFFGKHLPLVLKLIFDKNAPFKC